MLTVASTLWFKVHWQFHPATHLWRKIVDSGEYGRIIRLKVNVTCTPGIPVSDHRWKYEMAGTLRFNSAI